MRKCQKMVNFVLYVIQYCGYLFKLCVILSWTRTCSSFYNMTSITDVIDKSKILSTMEYLTNSEPRIWPTNFVIINRPIVKLSAPLCLGSHFWHILYYIKHIFPRISAIFWWSNKTVFIILLSESGCRYCLELLW